MRPYQYSTVTLAVLREPDAVPGIKYWFSLFFYFYQQSFPPDLPPLLPRLLPKADLSTPNMQVQDSLQVGG